MHKISRDFCDPEASPPVERIAPTPSLSLGPSAPVLPRCSFQLLPAQEEGGPHLDPSPTAATCLKCLGEIQIINDVLIQPSGVEEN